MSRIEQIKAQIEAGGEGCVPYGSLSELLELAEEMARALEFYADGHCGEVSQAALAKYKAWNEG